MKHVLKSRPRQEEFDLMDQIHLIQEEREDGEIKLIKLGSKKAFHETFGSSPVKFPTFDPKLDGKRSSKRRKWKND